MMRGYAGANERLYKVPKTRAVFSFPAIERRSIHNAESARDTIPMSFCFLFIKLIRNLDSAYIALLRVSARAPDVRDPNLS